MKSRPVGRSGGRLCPLVSGTFHRSRSEEPALSEVERDLSLHCTHLPAEYTRQRVLAKLLNTEGTDTVWMDAPAGHAGDYYATCATTQTPMPVDFQTIEGGAGTRYGIAIEFSSGDDIVCSWYRIADTVGDGPNPSDDTVVELPATGAGPIAAGWWR